MAAQGPSIGSPFPRTCPSTIRAGILGRAVPVTEPLSTIPQAANWPSYYEKALAQGYPNVGRPAGSYHGIESQWPSNLSPTVGGGKASVLGNPDAIWQAIADGKPLVISTDAPARGDDGRPENLPGPHAFFAKGLDDAGNIVLGNPWGPPQPDAIMSKEQYEKYVTESAVIGMK